MQVTNQDCNTRFSPEKNDFGILGEVNQSTERRQCNK